MSAAAAAAAAAAEPAPAPPPPVDDEEGVTKAATTPTGSTQRPAPSWIPLESNPEVITAFARRLGMPRAFAFHDVYGLDDELLCMVPQPVRALVLLFPITPASEAFAAARDAELEAAGAPIAPAEGLFYMKQTVGNACGTIAMLHAIANSQGAMGLGLGRGEGVDGAGGHGGGGEEEGGKGQEEEEKDEDKEEGSFLRRFLAATAALSPAERGRYLERPPEGAPDLEAAHRRAAERGATAAPAPEDDVDLHFVALVPALGRVWELDGRRRGAVDHGPLSDGVEGFLADAARVARAFVAREAEGEGGGSLQFSLIALGPADEDEEE